MFRVDAPMLYASNDLAWRRRHLRENTWRASGQGAAAALIIFGLITATNTYEKCFFLYFRVLGLRLGLLIYYY